jgi:outer membrane protein TolC
VGYREGVGIQLDVLDARAELTDARRLLSLSVRNYNLALANLRRAEGRLKSFSLQRDNIGE